MRYEYSKLIKNEVFNPLGRVFVVLFCCCFSVNFFLFLFFVCFFFILANKGNATPISDERIGFD